MYKLVFNYSVFQQARRSGKVLPDDANSGVDRSYKLEQKMRRPWLKIAVALYLLQKFDELLFWKHMVKNQAVGKRILAERANKRETQEKKIKIVKEEI